MRSVGCMNVLVVREGAGGIENIIERCYPWFTVKPSDRDSSLGSVKVVYGEEIQIQTHVFRVDRYTGNTEKLDQRR